MKYVGNVQSQANAEVYAIASGTLPNGKPVVVNSDGTVSGVDETSFSEAIGSAQQFFGSTADQSQVAFDANSNRIVIAFRLSNTKGAYVVGTVNSANKTISFGTVNIFNNVSNTTVSGICFDSTNNKIIITWQNGNESNRGYVIVGNVDPSNNSMSFGSSVAYESGETNDANPVFDTNAGKVVIVFVDAGDQRRGKAIVGTVSGTSISFGSAATFHTDVQGLTVAVYDPTSQKVIIPYKDGNDADKGKCKVATVSGTSISFGNIATFESSNLSNDIAVAYDVNSSKVVVVYSDAGSSSHGKAVVGTVSGTTISFGSSTTFESATTSDIDISYDIASKVNVISYDDAGNSNYGTYIVGTVSGTSISFGTPVVFISNTYANPSSCYDSTAEKIILTSHNSSQGGIAFVLQNASTSTNLTAENYVGITNGVVDYINQEIGSEAVFENSGITNLSSAFDSNSNRVVVAYADDVNGDYGTAAVGTVSGTSISFGTPVVFETAQTIVTASTFDSNSNKVVIAYCDKGNSNRGTAVVGTVNPANNSITFGTPVVFTTGATTTVQGISITFDSNSNKVVIAYRNQSNSNYGEAIVGTVSGTNISFGNAVVYRSATVGIIDITFDSNSNKVVIVNWNAANSSYGEAIVGTVSGTNISFGSAVVYESAYSTANSIAFDSNSNKIVIAYRDNGNSNYGTAIVGTVSGTSISFGNPVVFHSGANPTLSITFDSSASKIIIAYQDESNSDKGVFVSGTVSGTSISFGSGTIFHNALTDQPKAVFDSNANKVVIPYKDDGDGNKGKAVVVQVESETRGSTASGSTAIIQAGGAVNTLQTGLTAGQQYFVQTDGTLSLTAGSPSVIAGTAVSATDLIVKG